VRDSLKCVFKTESIVRLTRSLKSLSQNRYSLNNNKDLRGMDTAGFEFLPSILLWFIRAFISSGICLTLGFVGIKILSFETTKIREFESIKENPLGTSLFVGGFLIYAGLVVYGSMVNPFFLSQSVTIGSYFNLERLLVVIISFFASLLFGWLFYLAFDKLSLFGIKLDNINNHPNAVGVFLLCYQVFLGLIILASLTIPL
jgi:uncharacterized membrane protein YjfL (UPF0719 family)